MRNKGTFPFAANFKVQLAGMLDARMFCETYADLLTGYDATDFMPNGFPVAVFDEDPELRGWYQLINKNELSKSESWVKLGGGTIDPEDLANKADLINGKVPASQLPALGTTRSYADIATRDAETDLEGLMFALVLDPSDDLTLPPGHTGSALYVLLDGGEWSLYDVEGIDINSVSEEDITFDVTVGSWEAGDTLPTGSTWVDAVKKMGTATFYPALVNPTFSIGHGGYAYKTIGELISVTLGLTYNAGGIYGQKIGGVWNPSSPQGNRGGAASEYMFYDDANAEIGGGITNTFTVVNHTVEAGANTFKGDVTYDVGIQPKDSNNVNYDAPYPAGTSPLQVTSFEGVYPFFATTLAGGIGTGAQLPLTTNANASWFEVELAAESGSSRQRIWYPKLINDNGMDVVKIEYFNSVSGSFDTANKLGDWTNAATTRDILGNTVNYRILTYNGPTRGSLRVRVYYS